MSPSPGTKKQSARILRDLFSPYRWLVAAILGASLLASLLEGLHVAAFFPVFQALMGNLSGTPPAGALQFLTGWVRRIPVGDPTAAAALFLLAITGARCLAVLAHDALIAWAGGAVHDDLKIRLLRRYAASGYSFFLDHKQGQLFYILYYGTSRVGVLAQKLPKLVSELLMVAGISALLFASFPSAALLLAVVGLAYHGLTRLLSARVSYHTGQGRVASGTEQSSIANEFLGGIRHILAYGTQPSWLERFRKESRRFRNLYVRDAVWLSVPKVLLEFSVVFVLVGLLLVLRLRQPEFLSQHLPLFAFFAVGILRVLPSLSHMGQLGMEISGLLPDAEAVHGFLTRPVAPPPAGSRPLAPFQRQITLEGLGFAYPGREPLFRGVNVVFQKGGTTAIVGPSGGGKSTLAYLLLGLLAPTQGRILVDGVSLQEYPLEEWRRRIGFVSQDLFLLHASVAENIRFGRQGFSQGQIRRAAERALAASFIEELPQGYETTVGERGMKLSGGQQQRVAIARAILHDPEILVFDEATSFLDAESERLVQRAIEQVSQHRTVILIAHRLSTVREADKIIVMEQGRVLEEGRHEDLIRTQGRYFRLYSAGGERVGTGGER